MAIFASASWWLDLSREQFAARLPTEAERMALSRRTVGYTVNPMQFQDPPRKARMMVYTYHLEAGIVEP